MFSFPPDCGSIFIFIYVLFLPRQWKYITFHLCVISHQFEDIYQFSPICGFSPDYGNISLFTYIQFLNRLWKYINFHLYIYGFSSDLIVEIYHFSPIRGFSTDCKDISIFACVWFFTRLRISGALSIFACVYCIYLMQLQIKGTTFTWFVLPLNTLCALVWCRCG